MGQAKKLRTKARKEKKKMQQEPMSKITVAVDMNQTDQPVAAQDEIEMETVDQVQDSQATVEDALEEADQQEDTQETLTASADEVELENIMYDSKVPEQVLQPEEVEQIAPEQGYINADIPETECFEPVEKPIWQRLTRVTSKSLGHLTQNPLIGAVFAFMLLLLWIPLVLLAVPALSTFTCLYLMFPQVKRVTASLLTTVEQRMNLIQ
ncbi:hypothetical protein EDD86DRAFT_210590 [Gorgonomyces haynaldii]|nr:hypothetical protein EDD86DRAFT_210590 [Gorgonomyces haynaldii]